MPRPIIALLTDFGTRDHYSGVMKGVILGICPDVTLVDVTHDLPPHNIAFAAQELAATYRHFPAGTIFLVVVDPGVGTARRGLAADAADRKFIAPDNGVLTAVLKESPPKRVVELSERKYARPTVSRTFEGRDRFAPAAAFIAKGIHLEAFGRPVSDYCEITLPVPELRGDVIHGEVVRVDRFGNIVTNVDRRSCEKIATGLTGLKVWVGGRPIGRLVSTYADLPPGEVGALFGSTEHLECAAQSANAAEQLGVSVGAAVEVQRAM
jgi:S-adenosyl-L-methionine hydrolase (adenosine-forming)